MTETATKLWWGCIYNNGNLSAAFYNNDKALELARADEKVMAVYGPFEAKDRYEARHKTDELHASAVIPLRIPNPA